MSKVKEKVNAKVSGLQGVKSDTQSETESSIINQFNKFRPHSENSEIKF